LKPRKVRKVMIHLEIMTTLTIKELRSRWRWQNMADEWRYGATTNVHRVSAQVVKRMNESGCR